MFTFMGVVFSAQNEHSDVKPMVDMQATEQIAFQIFDHCDTLSVIHLMTVCKASEHLIRKYMANAYDVNNIYTSFFACHSRCLEFRRMLADTGALVSGYQAVQLFSRSYDLDSSLDIHIHYSQTDAAACWLLRQGYRHVPTSTNAMGWSQICEQMGGTQDYIGEHHEERRA